jgi:hypothetical protein
VGVLQTDAAQVEITPVGTSGAVVGMAERILTDHDGKEASRAITKLHTQGDLVADPPDQIVMPTAF